MDKLQTGLLNDLGQENATQIIHNKIYKQNSGSVYGQNTHGFKNGAESDFMQALTDPGKFNNVLNHGSIEKPVNKDNSSNLTFKLASENQVTIESNNGAKVV